MSRSLSKGKRGLGRSGELGYSQIDKNVDSKMQEAKSIGELGKQFESDKAKLEGAMERVINAKISDDDKVKMLDQLDMAMTEVRDQFEDDVMAEEKRIEGEIEEEFEKVDEAVEEIDEVQDTISDVSFDAANVDLGSASNEADVKKQEFLRMKNEHAQKLAEQQQFAADMRRRMHNNRFGR